MVRCSGSFTEAAFTGAPVVLFVALAAFETAFAGDVVVASPSLVRAGD